MDEQRDENEQVEDLDTPESEAEAVKGGAYEFYSKIELQQKVQPDPSIRNAWPKKYSG